MIRTVLLAALWGLSVAKAQEPAPQLKPTIQQLKLERQHLTRVLKSVEGMLSAPSFAERARIYCRSQIPAFPLIPSLGTVEELEVSYADLLREEPATREEEMKRQSTLDVWRKRLAMAYENTKTCQGSITTGLQSFPNDDLERKMGAVIKNRGEEIDKELSASSPR